MAHAVVRRGVASRDHAAYCTLTQAIGGLVAFSLLLVGTYTAMMQYPVDSTLWVFSGGPGRYLLSSFMFWVIIQIAAGFNRRVLENNRRARGRFPRFR